ncbi:MAG: pseudaminic acid synthase, partial [Kordiimonadaceae bacterium]|nr:pseudaminic acid synthase [Kordiimonadaceae bacterium]
MATPAFEIDGRPIGNGHKPYIIAEVSGNHMGDLDKALALIDVAKEAGANAVKFQTYEAHTITLDSDAPAFIVQEDLWKGKKLYELYEKAQTPFAWHEALFAKAAAVGITAFSAPFDHSAVDLLESLNCPAYKIASCELVDIPLLKKVAATGKPLILSTGMATPAEIEEAQETVKTAGATQVALLHCISGYPTPYADANIATIAALRATYALPTGISDHTIGNTVPVAATALGACIIEKHICLGAGAGAVDEAFSLSPEELRQMVLACNQAYEATGAVTLAPTPSESDSLRFRRSLYFTDDIPAGGLIAETAVRSLRPAGGL